MTTASMAKLYERLSKLDFQSVLAVKEPDEREVHCADFRILYRTGERRLISVKPTADGVK